MKNDHKDVDNLENKESFHIDADINIDEWKSEVVEELRDWLKNIQEKKTEYGEPLVVFPDGWENTAQLTLSSPPGILLEKSNEKLLNEDNCSLEQEHIINEIDDQIMALENELFDPNLPKEDKELLEKEILVPRIDISGPNPFEIPEEAKIRLKKIDEKLNRFPDQDLSEPSHPSYKSNIIQKGNEKSPKSLKSTPSNQSNIHNSPPNSKKTSQKKAKVCALKDQKVIPPLHDARDTD